MEQVGSCPGAVTNPLQKLACGVRSGMDQIAGTTAVRVSVAQSPTGGSGQPWKVGSTLRICALTQHQALLPLVPFPNNGISFTRVDMPIESAATITGTPATYADAPPSGSTWAQCP